MGIQGRRWQRKQTDVHVKVKGLYRDTYKRGRLSIDRPLRGEKISIHKYIIMVTYIVELLRVEDLRTLEKWKLIGVYT